MCVYNLQVNYSQNLNEMLIISSELLHGFVVKCKYCIHLIFDLKYIVEFESFIDHSFIPLNYYKIADFIYRNIC